MTQELYLVVEPILFCKTALPVTLKGDPLAEVRERSGLKRFCYFTQGRGAGGQAGFQRSVCSLHPAWLLLQGDVTPIPLLF